MKFSALTALSPLDGRYQSKFEHLRPLFSEYGLIYHRVFVEIRWLQNLAANREIPEVVELSKKDHQFLEQIIEQFDINEAEEVKTLEATTNHDVKAVEYYLRTKIEQNKKLKHLSPFIHFACTSEDINNLAYGLMLKRTRDELLSKTMQSLINNIKTLAETYKQLPMLSRTHGQPATPTTLGKELNNFVYRLTSQLKQLLTINIQGKFNGAVGNYNAHHIAYPNIKWPEISKQFVTELGLTWNSHTTQIEPHDTIAELMHCFIRFNNILIDFNRDIWGYISLNYFTQQQVEHEIGSSTMPHKVNPIDFENSEGNLGLANALGDYFANKLPVSRWQRDLSDSTVLRNLGMMIGYCELAYQNSLKGLSKLTANEQTIKEDLAQHWEVLAEAVQTVMRKHGITDAYEKLKTFTRGKNINEKLLEDFIEQLAIPDDAKQQLKALQPEKYIGFADKL